MEIVIAVIVVLFVLILALSALFFRRTKTRGEMGEDAVKRVIGKTKENKRYVINDLILQHGDMTSQIDHVVVNPRGIFVIETKNYSGKIFGTTGQREWTQILADGRTQNKFYNPVKQNATHVYAVKEIVGKLPVRSLVVFVQNNVEHIEADNVIPLYLLKRELNRGEDVLTDEEMKNAYLNLVSHRADVTHKEHIENVHRQQNDIKNGICPHCKVKLVLRHGPYGYFWGCPNYPKCKFKKKLDE